MSAAALTPTTRPRVAADALDFLTPRELEVLACMAEGRTNVGIARRHWLTERTVETHVARILSKLTPYSTDEDHRRVQAVLAYLESLVNPPGKIVVTSNVVRNGVDQGWF